MSNNPLRTAYDACVEMLKSKDDFVAQFDDLSLVTLNAEFVWKPTTDLWNPMLADYPRIRLWYSAGKPATEDDSSKSLLDMYLSWQVQTGAQQQTLLMDIQWAIYRAMLNWRTYVKDSVTWNGKPFVYDVDALEVKIEEEQAGSSRKGIMGDESKSKDQWVTVWATKIAMYFDTPDLIAY